MKVLILFSGGIDSFVLLDLLKKNMFEPICLFIDYGQIANINEFEAFNKIIAEDIDPDTRKYLADYYRPYNEKLYKLLNVDYQWG